MAQKTSPAVRRTKGPGSLKRDINLLPASGNSERLARRGIIILAVIISLLIFAFFAIYLPLKYVKGLQDNAASLENQAALLEAQATEMGSKAAQRDALKEMIASLESMEKDNIPPADVFAMLKTICPNAITLLSYTQNKDGLIISGRTSNDAEIAQFIVNLRTVPYFHDITLTGVRDNEENQNAVQKRIFEVKAHMADSNEPIPTSAVPDATAKDGDGKWH